MIKKINTDEDKFVVVDKERSVSISDIKILEEIYPRKEASQEYIKSYVEGLESNVTYPPVIVQKVFMKEEDQKKEVLLLLDGLHRIEAYKKKGLDTIGVKEWKDETLDLEEHRDELHLEAAKLNVSHGYRLNREDLKRTAQRIAKGDPQKEITVEKISQKINVPKSTVQNWISEIRAEQKAEQDALIKRLTRLGWSAKEISNCVSMELSTLRKRLKIYNLDKTQVSIREEFQKGDSIGEISERHSMEPSLAWSLVLEGLDDDTRYQELEKHNVVSVKRETVWGFTSGGSDEILKKIIMNLLYHFTEAGDLVFQLFPINRIVIDACLITGRKYLGVESDRSMSLGKEILFEYTEDILNNAEIIYYEPSPMDPGMNREEHLICDAEVLKEIYKDMKIESKIVIMAQSFINPIDPTKSIYIHDYHQMLLEVGFKPLYEIHCPQTVDGEPLEGKKMADTARSLLVFHKI